MANYTVAFWQANQATLDSGPDFNIQDTAANISGALDQLNGDAHIDAIVIADNAPVDLDVAQLTGDAAAIGKLQNADASAVSLVVEDTAANIVAGLGTLNVDSEVSSIVITDNQPLVISVAQLLANSSALSILVNGNASAATLTISDTAANIGANFATLNQQSDVTSIVVSDNAPVTITATQLVNDTAALGELVNANLSAATAIVKDTAANVAANLDAIQAAGAVVSSVVISNSQPMTVTASQVVGDAGALAKVSNNNAGPVTYNVSDTAAHVSANLDALQADSHIGTITVSDNAAVAVTVAQMASDAGAIGELVNANASPYTLAVTDTAANIDSAFDALGGNIHVARIVVTDSATHRVTVTVAQLTADSAAIAVLFQADGTTPASVTVVDTAAHITVALNSIDANGHVGRIDVSDSATQQVNVTVAQLTSDAAALAKLFQADDATAAHVTVDDTAAHISAAFDALSANAQVDKIVVSNQGTHEVSVKVAQLTTDAAALGELFKADGTTPAHVAVTDTAAHISAALDALSANAQVDKIVISDSAGHAVGVTVARLTSDASALGELFLADGVTHATVAVKDTAANISAAFDALNGNTQVDKIVVTDSGSNEVVVTVTQLSSDTAALGELFLANGATHAHVEVSDTAANISAAIDGLNGNSQVDSVVISDNAALALNASQVADDTVALGEIVNQNATSVSIHVSDAAGAISSNLDALQANGHVTRIVVTDSGSNEVVVSVGQLTGDATMLAELFKSDGTTPATVTVSDTAAHVTAALDALNGNAQVDKIYVSDSPTDVTVTVAQLASDATVIGEIYYPPIGGNTHAEIAVSDTAAHIQADFDSLSGNLQVNKIVVSDSGSSKVVVTVGQLGSDAAGLAKLFNSDGTTPAQVVVADTAAKITTALDSLSGNSQIASITVNDSATNQVVVKVAQLAGDAHALAELFQADGTTPAPVTVKDSAAHISSALDALSANGQVDKIIVSNSGSAAVTATVAQLTGDAAALAELFQADGTTPAHVTVKDTAAHVSAALDGLNGNSQVNRIVVTDSGSHAVTVTVAQIASDAAALAELFQSDGTTPAHVTVNDTAASISAALDSLSPDAQVNKIVVSDSATNEVAVTVAQITGDAAALAELFQANGATAAHVAVRDTAGHIAAAFDALNGNGQVDKIVVGDSGSFEVTISAAQAASDTAALSELFQADGATPAHVAVSDTAANVSAAIDALNGNGHVDKIVVSDSATGEVTVSAAQAGADSIALGELFQADGASPAHVKVSDNAANISGAFDALNGNGHVDKIVVSDSATHEVTIAVGQAAADGTALGELFRADGTTPAHVAVSDTAAAISGGFDALNGNSHVDKIVVSDSASNEVVISASQAGADVTALGELFQADGTTPGHVEVLDTAADITATLDNLSANASVDKIVVSNSASAAVAVTVAQLTGDAVALAELFQADGTTPAHVTVADTAAHISAAIDGLAGDSQVDKIVVGDSGSNNVNVNVAQVTSDAAALAELFQADGTTPATITVTDTASHVSAALDALNADGQVTRIVISNNAAITVTAARAAHDTQALSELVNANATPVTLNVSDKAANIVQYLDALNAISNISQIVISNNLPLTLTAAEVADDQVALGKLANKNGSGVIINVVDTAANISAHLDALNATNDLSSVTVSDSAPITVTVAQIASDSVILSELQNQNGSPIVLTVEDTAANILANIASLQQNAQITAIVISDNAPLTLSVAQLSADAGALAEMSNANGQPYALIVSDNSTHISNALDALNGNSHIASIVVTNNASLTVTVARIASDATALSKVVDKNGNPYTLTVSDTAAHISAGLDGLSANSHVTRIVVNNSAGHEVTVTVAQLTGDATALGELFQADGVTPARVAVTDSAANITAAFDSLNGNTQVDKIVVTDSASAQVSVTVAQLTSDATALGELFKADGATPATVTVADTAANVTGALNSLNGNAQVTKIVVSDSATNEVTVTVAQLTSDAAALAELFQADAATLASVEVIDTAANVTAALDALNGDGQVASIVVSDSGSNEVIVTVAQIGSDAAALAKMFQSDGDDLAHVKVNDTGAHVSAHFDLLNSDSQVDSIVVSNNAALNLSAGQVAGDLVALAETVNQDASPIVIDVSDTAAAISTNLDALQANGHVAKVVVSDSGSHEVSVSVAQLTGDATVLGELFRSDGTTPASVAVSDTAAHVSAALDSLNADAQVDHIVISDNAAVSLSIAQLTGDSTALGEMIDQNGAAVSLDVVDTAAHIAAHLDTLEANTQISTVTVSNNAPVVLTVAKVVNDPDVIAALINANGTAASVTVSDTAANIAANIATLNAQSQVTSIVISNNATLQLTAAQLATDTIAVGELSNQDLSSVSIRVKDTAANIAANFGAIQAADSVVTSVVISNNAAVALTASQAVSDTATLAKLVDNNGSPYSLTILDTAANIGANFDQLEGNVSHIGAVTFTDAGTPTLTLTQSQATADASLLARITNAYDLTVTGVTGQPYTSYTNFYAAGDVLNYSTQFNTDGSITDHVFASGLSLTGTANNDAFFFTSGTNEHVVGGAGNDSFHFLGNFAANDQINGGAGTDSLALNGDYTGGNALVMNASTMTNVERLSFIAGHSYDVTENDGNLAAGRTLIVNGGTLGAGDSLVFDGSAETDGKFKISGGAGNDVLTGGAGKDNINAGNGTNTIQGGLGADSLTGGNGADTFVYGSAAESTGVNRDTIHGFDAATDFLGLPSAVTGIDATVASGTLSGGHFDANLAAAVGAGQLAANHAVLFTPTAGNLAGHTFLIVDLNGVAGYQSGGDLVVDVTGATNLGSLSVSNFT
ncbi:MAG TPA: calcium-binding protein [Rhizomicrobium sp.]|nr:calcium-binding protein [Rhizomicrobium sp.]